MVRTENVWHLAVTGVKTGTEYGFRIHGEFANPNKLMLDPYAKAVNGKPDLSSEESCSWFLLSDNRDNAHLAPRAVVISEDFNWENDTLPNTPWAETIVYELHVKGFSQLNEKIPCGVAWYLYWISTSCEFGVFERIRRNCGGVAACKFPYK